VKQLAPDLFARRFGDLMEIGRARLPALAPEWTDHNAHDPGITLMELLAWVTEAQLYSLSPRPRRDERAAYAALLGLVTGGARPARGVIWADPRDPRSPATTFAKSVAIPADAVVHLLDAETPTFRPTHRLLWAPGRIAKLESRLANGRTVNLTATNERGGLAFLPFGERAGKRDVLAMTFAARDENGLFGANPGNRSRRADTKGALWAIGVRAAASPGDGGDESDKPLRECHPLLAATLVADGRRVPVRVAADSSDGMLRSGVLLLDLDAVSGSPREVTLELRAPDGLPRPPRLLHLEPNVVPVEQGRAIVREVHVATGQPDWSFQLDVPGLRFAAGEEPLLLEVDEPDAVRVWQRSDRLADRGPDERVYELDAGRGEVTFGNGVNGRVPPAGAQVLASYAVCDGEEGRVARNRRWHVDGFEGAFGVNLDPVSGGAAPSAWVEQRREARRRAREEHALVSSEDLVAAARAQPLLEVARAWVLPPRDGAPRTGTVTLVAMRARPGGKEPADGAGQAPPVGLAVPETARWLTTLRRRLVGRLPLGARLVVRGPRYVDFFVTATLLADPGRDPDKVAEAVDREIDKRLALVEPAPGQPALGRPIRRPGVPVTRRDLSAWIRSVDGVRDVVELRLRRVGRRVDESEVPVPRDGLPRLDSSRSAIQVRRSTSGSAP
jgi:predicted phage baseplate assembly protein